jgi:hypothetical protein
MAKKIKKDDKVVAKKDVEKAPELASEGKSKMAVAPDGKVVKNKGKGLPFKRMF